MGNLNEVLGDTNAEAYGRAQAATSSASSVREAVEGMGILERLKDAEVAEAQAVMAALPRAVELAILGATSAGFERRVPIGIEWHRGDAISVNVREEATEVHIVLTTPNGQDFL